MKVYFRPLHVRGDYYKLVYFLDHLGEKTNKNWTNHWTFNLEEDSLLIADKIRYAADHKIFVGLHNNEIVAVGHLHHFVKNNCYLGMAVRDNYQNKGIGTKLLKYLIKQARILGIKCLYLNVYNDNKVARHLYEKHGFKYSGLKTTEIVQQRVKLEMYKEL